MTIKARTLLVHYRYISSVFILYDGRLLIKMAWLTMTLSFFQSKRSRTFASLLLLPVLSLLAKYNC